MIAERSFVEAVHRRAMGAPNEIAVTFLVGGRPHEHVTRGELDRRARAIAARLLSSCQRGDRALLLYPPGPDFVVSFLGCLYAGIVAVPAPLDVHAASRISKIVSDSSPATVLVTRVEDLPAGLDPLMSQGEVIATATLTEEDVDWEPCDVGEELAFIQYTSGSTQEPRGAAVSHDNLLHNEQAITRAFGLTTSSVVLNWLPVHHDMGLIGGVLQPLFIGARSLLMSPLDFVVDPSVWLRAISDFEATASGGPNFAYDLCVQRIDPADLAGIDLRSWRVAFNGAEPVRAETLNRFVQRFAPFGFRRDAFFPCYGLAESTLCVTAKQGRDPVVRRVSAVALETRRTADPSDDRRSRALVSSGRPVLDTEIAIVDPDTSERVSEGDVGEVWVTGPSVARGYWGKRRENDPFEARLDGDARRYLRTGDVGFLLGGELFITGRTKDLIIIRGRNLYPQDLEMTAQQAHAALRPNCGAAFTVDDGVEERLVVVQEMRRGHESDLESVADLIRTGVAAEHGVTPHEVVLVSAGAVPKTSSGKIQRGRCRELLLAGSLHVLILSSLDGHVEAPAHSVRRRPAEGTEGIRRLIAGLLDRDPTNIPDNRRLLSLGLDSLLMMRLAHELSIATGAEISVDELFEIEDVRSLSDLLSERATGTLRMEVRAAGVGDSEDKNVAPLSSVQERLWILDGIEGGTGRYNVAVLLDLSGQLEVAKLELALNELALTHPALRTVVTVTSEGLVQKVLESHPMELRVLDVAGGRQDEAAIESAMRSAAQEPFDLANGPLWRALLLQRSESEHALVLTVHHIACDGWSMRVLVEDLFDVYSALVEGGRAELKLAHPYTAYARSERKLAPSIAERQLAYWERALAGLPPVASLPTDGRRAPSPISRRHLLELDEMVLRELAALAAVEGTTMFVAALASVALLLARQTGQLDVAIGTPVVTRDKPELNRTVGPFLNNLAIRVDLSGDPTHREALRRTAAAVRGALENRTVPYERVVEALQAGRPASERKLFQVFVNMLSFGERTLELPNLHVEVRPILDLDAKFDLSIYIDVAETTRAVFVYDENLFASERMQELASQLNLIMQAVARRPDDHVSDTSLVTKKASALLPDLTVALDNTWHGPVHGRVTRWSHETPDRIAVRDARTEWTYRELERRSNQLARCLAAAGVTNGDVVALLARRNASLVCAIVGALKAGAAFLILDPALPSTRLVEYASTAGARALVCMPGSAKVEAPLREAVQEAGGTSIALPELPELRTRDLLAAWSDDPLDDKIGPDDPACITFTSGTTGTPKGVVGRHGSLTHFLPWQAGHWQLGSEDRFSMLSGLGNDPLQRDIFTSLWVGGTICIPDEERILSPAYLVTWLHQERITVANLSPAHARVFASARGDLPSLDRLRYGFFIGEELTWADVHALRSRATGVAVVNLYGTTETQRALSFHVVSSEETSRGAAEEIVPLGRSAPGMHILVVREGRPAGIGEVGEIWIRSPHLARGYLGDEDLTKNSFLANPFVERPDSRDRVFRTGDLGRFRPDGTVTFAGRIDREVQIRGFRVQPEEVERALAAHPEVAECAVVPVDDSLAASKILAAFVVLRSVPVAAEERDERSRALLETVRARLPAYMVPSSIEMLSALPRTAGGKVDYDALPAPTIRSLRPRERRAPATPIQTTLAELWTQVLGHTEFGIDDAFFDVGGNSLLAARLVERVFQELKVELPLRVFFEYPTIEGLALFVARAVPSSDGEELPTAVPDPVSRYDPFPLNEIQQAYWVGRHEAFQLGNVASHVYLEFDGRHLDVDRLSRAWNRLVSRHDMLRTVMLPGGFQRTLPDPGTYEIEVWDLRSLEPAGREDRLRATRERMSHLVRSGAAWPLFDVSVSRIDDVTSRIHISVDFLVGDASCYGVIGPELTLLYREPDAELPPLELTFRDYVLAEQRLLESPRYQASLDYWRRRIETLPPAPELPLARDPATISQPRFVRRSASVPRERWERIKTRAASYSLTPACTLLAAYAEILACWSKSPDFTVNLTLFNRRLLHPQVDRIVGDFTSLTLLEVRHDGSVPFSERARRIQQQVWRDLEHRSVSGVTVLRDLARARGGPAAATMPVVFTSKLGLRDLIHEMGEIDWLGDCVFGVTQTPQVWLDHQVGESKSGDLVFNWDAVEELFPAGMLDDMFVAYRGLLDRLADDVTLGEAPALDLLPPHQFEQRVLVNATEGPLPTELLHEPFLARAAENPDAIAAISGTGRLCYGELLERGAAIAEQLDADAVERNRLVAVVMEKGGEQVAAVLGILMAGAAYLPIDPELPEERIAYLLGNGEIRVALTQTWIDAAIRWPEGVRRLSVDALGRAAVGRAKRSGAVLGDLAYVIYTSGSTGEPQGVMIDHRGAANTVADINDRFGIGPDDRVFGISALSFDLSVFDIFGPLGRGGALVVPAESERRDPAAWLETLERERVTVWNSVPALAQMLVTYAHARSLSLPPSLRLVMLSGDWIPVELPDQLRALAPQVEVVSLGGATEASIWSIWHPIREVDQSLPSIPYGRPLRNQQFYVLDRSLAPRPDWVPGDLYIGGVGLANGYWRNPQRTNERFFRHPRTGERIYRTGDVGRYLPGGDIEFLGREDFQVKIHGYRIELGEIEAALVRHPTVSEAAAVARGDDRGGRGKRLVAYVVPESIEAPDGIEAELVRHLRATLPEYMLPSAIVTLDRFPLTANGKVDRKALPEPTIRTRVRAASASTMERLISKIFADVLERSDLGPLDNFFDFGGTSIMLVTAHAKVCELLGYDVPIRVMFQYATPRDLADFLAVSRQQDDDGSDSVVEGARRAGARRRLRRSGRTS